MPDNEVNKRLRLFLLEKKINKPSELGKAIGYLSAEKLSRLFRNPELMPSSEIILDIAKVFADLNLNWLLIGNGKMLLIESRMTNEPIGEYKNKEKRVLHNSGCIDCEKLKIEIDGLKSEIITLKDELLDVYRPKKAV